MKDTLNRLSKVIFTMTQKRYLAYIRSQAWMQRRRKHLAEYPLCQIDGWRPAIQVHHWYYGRLGNERREDLCSVCRHCHHQLHCMTIPDPANDNEQFAFSFDGNDAA